MTLEQAIEEPWRLDEPCTLDLGIGAKAEITKELAEAHENFWYWLNRLEDAEPHPIAWEILNDMLHMWVGHIRTRDNMLAATAVYASVMRGAIREMKRAKECFSEEEDNNRQTDDTDNTDEGTEH